MNEAMLAARPEYPKMLYVHSPEIFIYGRWWDVEVILASTPYGPRMTPAPQPTVENYEDMLMTLGLFRRMEVLSYVR